jgi:hypothetical protein
LRDNFFLNFSTNHAQDPLAGFRMPPTSNHSAAPPASQQDLGLLSCKNRSVPFFGKVHRHYNTGKIQNHFVQPIIERILLFILYCYLIVKCLRLPPRF